MKSTTFAEEAPRLMAPGLLVPAIMRDTSKKSNGAGVGSFAAPLTSEPLPILQWIEVASSFQIPAFHIVGLPSPEVAEARERVRAAIESSGREFPRRRIVLNLAPASIRKRGTGLELAMALAVLSHSEEKTGVKRLVAWGELGLDGSVKPAGQITRTVFACWQAGTDFLLVAREDFHAALEKVRWLRSAAELPGPPPTIVGVASLEEALNFLENRIIPEVPAYAKPRSAASPASVSCKTECDPPALLPLSPSLERVIGVAAAGAHHLFLLGPRGTGKSQAVEWLVALQPPTSALDRVRAALLRELREGPGEEIPSATLDRPVRRIGSQARPQALLGGTHGFQVRPGEFSLAHGGLLIADELPEWPRDTRECLREPLERGVVTLTRAQGSIEFPARFVLAANGNLCPCGGWPPHLPIPRQRETGVRTPRCQCNESRRKGYLARLSGPVMDRMDLVFLVSELPDANAEPGETRLKALRSRVEGSREQTRRLWGEVPGMMSATDLEAWLRRKPAWSKFLLLTPTASLRGRHKVLRLAMSLAAWDGEEEPSSGHFFEASCYRPERYGLLQ